MAGQLWPRQGWGLAAPPKRAFAHVFCYASFVSTSLPGAADTLHSRVIQPDKMQPLAVGVQQQALQRLKVAAAPCNHRRWRAPAVVLHFPSGVAESVCHELSGIGVHVTGPGALHGEAGCAAAAARLPASGSSQTLR